MSMSISSRSRRQSTSSVCKYIDENIFRLRSRVMHHASCCMNDILMTMSFPQCYFCMTQE